MVSSKELAQDFKPAYVNVEVDIPSPFKKFGGAVTGTLDRNGNVYLGSGGWGGSPGASASVG